MSDNDKCEHIVDVGFEITPGGQKTHVWLKPEDVATYCEELRNKVIKAETACAAKHSALRLAASELQVKFHNDNNEYSDPELQHIEDVLSEGIEEANPGQCFLDEIILHRKEKEQLIEAVRNTDKPEHEVDNGNVWERLYTLLAELVSLRTENKCNRNNTQIQLEQEAIFSDPVFALCILYKAVKLEALQLEKVVKRLKTAKLSQCGWEGNEDIVTLNGKPIGATITRYSREFDRWWAEFVSEIIGDAADAGNQTVEVLMAKQGTQERCERVCECGCVVVGPLTMLCAKCGKDGTKSKLLTVAYVEQQDKLNQVLVAIKEAFYEGWHAGDRSLGDAPLTIDRDWTDSQAARLVRSDIR